MRIYFLGLKFQCYFHADASAVEKAEFKVRCEKFKDIFLWLCLELITQNLCIIHSLNSEFLNLWWSHSPAFKLKHMQHGFLNLTWLKKRIQFVPNSIHLPSFPERVWDRNQYVLYPQLVSAPIGFPQGEHFTKLSVILVLREVLLCGMTP